MQLRDVVANQSSKLSSVGVNRFSIGVLSVLRVQEKGNPLSSDKLGEVPGTKLYYKTEKKQYRCSRSQSYESKAEFIWAETLGK